MTWSVEYYDVGVEKAVLALQTPQRELRKARKRLAEVNRNEA
ncbi:MAG: hypothetical protein V3S33_01010 [Gammaproteobacteria bacterium]